MASTHPSQEVITRYVQGRLPLAEAARWESHFLACDRCVQNMARVGSDRLSDLLKHSTSTEVQGIVVETRAEFPELPQELRNHSRYSVQKRLGHGGMGMVYHATHRLMNRNVALKMIRGDLLATPMAVTRFRREVQAAAQLDHPNIVTAFDAEEISGVHFLVMEYVEGKSLYEYVHQKGPLAVALACNLARQMAQGLHHAHRLGMIHRDIKPQNVMLTRQGKVKILDFGLARWSGRNDEKTLPQITSVGSHLGTLMYAAPEQRKSAGEVDARADLYSLGATLVFLLTGKPPPLQLEDIPSEEIPFPDAVPDSLRAVIRRLLMLSPEERYPSAKAVIEALAPFTETGAMMPAVSGKEHRLRYGLLAALMLVLLLMGLLVENYLSRRGHSAGLSSMPSSSVTVPTSVPASTGAASMPAREEVPAPSASWKSLLPLIDPRRDTVAGNWSLIDGELMVRPVRGARLAIPVEVPRQYDLRIIFTRKTGIHSVGAVLVHGGRQCTFELDSWEKHLAGFQNIDGTSMRENPTRREGYALENQRRYTLVIEVRADSMRVYLDGKAVTQYQGNGENLSIDEQYWAMPRNSTLGLLSWESQVVFHQVELRNR